jgi:hypothetical protein
MGMWQRLKINFAITLNLAVLFEVKHTFVCEKHRYGKKDRKSGILGFFFFFFFFFELRNIGILGCKASVVKY